MMTKTVRGVVRGAVVLAVCAMASACARSNQTAQRSSAAPPAPDVIHNVLTDAEREAGWLLLFDGKTFSGWRGYRLPAMPPGWSITDGALTKTGAAQDILNVNEFSDFELSIDWKIASGGNAGIFYRGTEEYERIYWSAPEYQLLDDATARDGQSRLTAAGAAYGLYPAPAGVVKPAGEWNSTRIVLRGPHVEHWLNGTKLLEYELGSPDWTAKVQASKFNDWPNYGKARRGYIAIQGDHEGMLSLRNIKLRELR